MRSLMLSGLTLLSVTTGCRFADGSQIDETEVRVVWTGSASTAVYRAEAGGGFALERIDGTATLTVSGAAEFGLSGSATATPLAPVAHPLARKSVRLTEARGGADLVFAEGETCRLEFVTGNWAEYVAGRDVVLKLSKDAWERWMSGCHAAYIALVDGVRRDVEARLAQNQDAGESQVGEVILEEDPLIRANRGHLMVFFEPVRIEGGFVVYERRPDRGGWRFAGFTPAAKRFFTGLAVVTLAAAEVGAHFVCCCARR